jgi:hypothetical protein
MRLDGPGGSNPTGVVDKAWRMTSGLDSAQYRDIS